MTQALTNNIDIMQNSELLTSKQVVSETSSDESTIDNVCDDVLQDFDKILDKTLNIVNEKSNTTEDDDAEVVPMLFEELLTFINNIQTNNNQEIDSDDKLSINELDIQQDTSEDIAFKIKDYEELDLDKTENNTNHEIDRNILDDLNIESVETNNDPSNNETMTQQETADGFGLKVMLNHSAEKTDITFEKAMDSTNVKPSNITPEKIIEQITKGLDSLKSNSGVKIVLNPESLGKVDLQIINTKEGLSAQFTVTTNETRELLMKGIEGLKETLITNGIGVDNLSIKVAESEENSYNPDWTEQDDSQKQGQNFNRQRREEKDKGLFEKTIAENMKNNNGKV